MSIAHASILALIAHRHPRAAAGIASTSRGGREVAQGLASRAAVAARRAASTWIGRLPNRPSTSNIRPATSGAVARALHSFDLLGAPPTYGSDVASGTQRGDDGTPWGWGWRVGYFKQAHLRLFQVYFSQLSAWVVVTIDLNTFRASVQGAGAIVTRSFEQYWTDLAADLGRRAASPERVVSLADARAAAARYVVTRAPAPPRTPRPPLPPLPPVPPVARDRTYRPSVPWLEVARGPRRTVSRALRDYDRWEAGGGGR